MILEQNIEQSVTASQITNKLTICSTVSSSENEEKYQSSTSLVLCEYDPPVTGGFPSQNDNNVESVSILWLFYEYPSILSKTRQGIAALCM